MKYLKFIVFILGFHVILNMVLPWWNVVIAGALAAYFAKTKKITSLVLGLIVVFVTWYFLLYRLDIANAGVLSEKISAMLNLHFDKGSLVLSALVGSLVGGAGALTGSWARKSIAKFRV